MKKGIKILLYYWYTQYSLYSLMYQNQINKIDRIKFIFLIFNYKRQEAANKLIQKGEEEEKINLEYN